MCLYSEECEALTKVKPARKIDCKLKVLLLRAKSKLKSTIMPEFILQSTLDVPELNISLPEFLEARAKEQINYGKTNFIVDSITGEASDFQSFQSASKKVASALYKKGLRKGDVILYMCYDMVKLPVFFNGVWRANGIVKSCYSEETEDSILASLTEAKAIFILCEDSEAKTCLNVAERAKWPVEVLIMGRADNCTSIYDLLQDDGNACPELEVTADDPALIFSTSGTTGRSKGAVHKHRSMVAFLQRYCYAVNLTDHKPNLYVCKAPHVSGCTIGLICLVNGKLAVIMSRISLENIFNAVDKYKPGFIFAFPQYHTALVNDPRARSIDKSCVEVIFTAGVSINPALLEELNREMPKLRGITIAYGLSECIMVSSHVEKLEIDGPTYFIKDTPVSSIGKVNPGTQVQIQDVENRKSLGPNLLGEICTKGLTQCSHYQNQEEETKYAFAEDGWFRTGDIGYYDEKGFLFFNGRIKEIFKCKGNHVSPGEIDEVISRHPAVANVCTVGIPDPEGGDKKPRAFVILKPGVSATVDEIKEFAHAKLAVYKHLRGGLFIVPDLPRGPSGKITRQLAAKICVSDE